jgi:putative oxidoreductase
MQRLKTIGTWVLQLLLAVLMAGPGWQKFTSPTWERMFSRWGFPDHFYLVIGAIEVVGGVGLLIPRVATYSAIVLMVVMIGAAVTQLTVGGRNGVGEIVFAALLGVIAYARRRDAWRPSGASSKPAIAAS